MEPKASKHKHHSTKGHEEGTDRTQDVGSKGVGHGLDVCHEPISKDKLDGPTDVTKGYCPLETITVEKDSRRGLSRPR